MLRSTFTIILKQKVFETLQISCKIVKRDNECLQQFFICFFGFYLTYTIVNVSKMYNEKIFKKLTISENLLEAVINEFFCKYCLTLYYISYCSKFYTSVIDIDNHE